MQPRYKVHGIEGYEDNQEEQEGDNTEEVVQKIGFWSSPIEPDYVEQESEREQEYSLW